MNKILILWVALLGSLTLYAQEKGIEFQHITYREALDKAKAENKLVFMDCYTSWCGPCQNMLKNVFSRNDVGEFFNPRFINVKFDMEKGEGIELRKKFDIRAFPTFLLIRPDGVVQHRIVGGGKAEDFIARVSRGMQEESSLLYLEKHQAKGKLNKKQRSLYMLALKDAGEDLKIKEVSGKEFEQLNDKERCSLEYWGLYDQREVGPGDERFAYLLKNKKKFDGQIGKELVDEKIYNSYYQALVKADQSGRSAHVDSVLWKMRAQVENADFKQKAGILYLMQYMGECNRKDVEGTLNFLDEHMKELPGMFLWNIPFRLNFIAESGTPQQLERYIGLEPRLLELLDNPQIKKLAAESFEQFRSVLHQKKNYAEIRGRVEKDKMEEVNLFKVEDGAVVMIAKTDVGKDGLYGFSFVPADSGYYLVGGLKELERIRIYLKPGDRAEVNILEDSLVITGKKSYENYLLSEWEGLFEPVRRRVLHLNYILYTYKQFFPYFLDFLPKAREFKNKINTRDEAFNERLKRTVDYDLDYMALMILKAPKADPETHRPGQPKPENYSGYYTTLENPASFRDAALLQQPYGVDFLKRYTDFVLERNGKERNLKNRLECLPDQLLQAELVLENASYARTYEQFRKVTDPYAAFLTAPSHLRRWNELCAKLYVAQPGKEAADFTYPDREGKTVSLSDFRGKVVLVDVWATWCGPCRAEVPYLVKLEKEMAGKEVVFIGVSVDERKDHQKWLEVLEKEQMEGVQLFADGWSKIVADYKIKGIPRFMVFDREGKVVSADAPRPSDPALKVLLEKTLKR